MIFLPSSVCYGPDRGWARPGLQCRVLYLCFNICAVIYTELQIALLVHGFELEHLFSSQSLAIRN
jgi:hypothetical protein